jgi:hypothetical protein
MSIIMVLVLLSAGCDGLGLRRTSTKRWETRTFRAEGLRLQIPAGSKVAHDPAFGVHVELHPVAPPWFRLEDTRYFVTVQAERKERQLLQDERESLMRDVQRTEDNEFQFWSAAEHPIVGERRGDHYSYYRYDVKCAGGDVVQLSAEVRHPVVDRSPKFQAEDDAIVRRIPNSAQCLSR